jgi:hypothetical protein
MRLSHSPPQLPRFIPFLTAIFFLSISLYLAHSPTPIIHPISKSVDYSLSRDCVRDLINDLCQQDSRNDTIGLIAAHADSYGAFGNNFIQLLILVQFSLLTGLKEIYVDDGFCWLSTGMTFRTPQGIFVQTISNISSIPYTRNEWINGRWFFPCCWCSDFTWRYLSDSIRDGLWQVIPEVSVDPETLYLYTRGGPLVWEYGGNVHPSYGQPPCDYYLQVMRSFKKVRIVGDFMNPCVKVAIEAGALWELYDDRRNFAVMVAAKYIVLATSSRSHVILVASFAHRGVVGQIMGPTSMIRAAVISRTLNARR